MSNIAVIGLGSNIHAAKNIQTAFSLLRLHFEVLDTTRVLKTSPIGITDQP